jgi:hypothetical protein
MQETAILLHRVGIGFVVLSIIDRCSVYEMPENAQVDLRRHTRFEKDFSDFGRVSRPRQGAQEKGSYQKETHTFKSDQQQYTVQYWLSNGGMM